LTNLGAALSRKGNAAEAVSVWRKAAELDPLSANAWFNLGYGSLVESNLGGAIRAFEQGLKMKGRDAEALYLLARAYERAGRAVEAQRLTADALRLSPRVERWSGRLPAEVERLAAVPGTSHRPSAVPPENLWSAQRLERRAASQDLQLWLQAVGLQVAAESFGEAIRQLREVAVVFPASAQPHEMLARIYEQQRNNALAVRELEAAARLDPSTPYLLALARAYRISGQPARALAAAEQVLKIDPGQPAASAMKKELEPAIAPRPARRFP
jgi:tetratricopeptide (TPR) repeat protein